MNNQLNQLIEESNYAVAHLPYSKCRNCEHQIRLFQGRWYHIEMFGGKYSLWRIACKRPYPKLCKKCSSKIDYKTTDVTYYDFLCQRCIEDYHKGDKIGDITKDLRKQLNSGNHKFLKYGTSCSVVLTDKGIYFEDIC